MSPAGQTVRPPCRAKTGPIHCKTPVIFKLDELATWPSGLEVHETITTVKEGGAAILYINVTNNTNHDIVLPGVACVRKRDGGMGLCIDYRELNKKTVPDRHPIPRIQEALDSLGGKSWFSVLGSWEGTANH